MYVRSYVHTIIIFLIMLYVGYVRRLTSASLVGNQTSNHNKASRRQKKGDSDSDSGGGGGSGVDATLTVPKGELFEAKCLR